MIRIHIFFISWFLFLAASAEPTIREKEEEDVSWKDHRYSGYKVIRSFPHDPNAFTQGLLWSDGVWLESTGGRGTSSVRRVDKHTGEVLLKKNLAAQYFGEGLAEFQGQLFQLTWEKGKGFIYDAKTLKLKGQFQYSGEGWGLTTDGKCLIMSDGTDKIRFFNPSGFKLQRAIRVKLNGKPIDRINELEYIEGEIFANVWHTDQILRIDPSNGKVIGVIDLRGIDRTEKRSDPEHVLNGIAYDSDTKSLFVTGKCWPKIYQIRLVKRQ